MIETRTAIEDNAVRLSRREMEVLRLDSKGQSSQEIADHIFVSRRTVEFHLASAFSKLGVSNRISALRRAQGLGLIPPESRI